MDTRNIEINKDMGIKLLTAYKPYCEDKLTELMLHRNYGKWSFSVREGEHWVWNYAELEKASFTIICGLIKLINNKYKWK